MKSILVVRYPNTKPIKGHKVAVAHKIAICWFLEDRTAVWEDIKEGSKTKGKFFDKFPGSQRAVLIEKMVKL